MKKTILIVSFAITFMACDDIPFTKNDNAGYQEELNEKIQYQEDLGKAQDVEWDFEIAKAKAAGKEYTEQESENISKRVKIKATAEADRLAKQRKTGNL